MTLPGRPPRECGEINHPNKHYEMSNRVEVFDPQHLKNSLQHLAELAQTRR